MKLLRWRPGPSAALPPAPERDATAGLREDDPAAYGRLIEHLIAGSPRVAEHRGPLLDGRATVVLTGQQPALLGGPLYTLYKVLTAVETARRIRERGGSAIAAFWCVGDDTDHDEVAAASWPGTSGPPSRVRDESPADGAQIGPLEVDRMRPAFDRLRAEWPGAASATLARIESLLAESAGSGWSGFLRRVLEIQAEGSPLLFLDGGDPEVVRSAQPWLRRFVAERASLAAEMDQQAADIRARGGVPVLAGDEARRCLFVFPGRGRRVLEERETPDAAAVLAPNVVLRPALQEYLLPVQSVICGEAEIAYRRLLGPVYRRTGRPAAPLARRFAATLFPPAWASDDHAPEPSDALADPDGAIERWALHELDPALLEEVARARGQVAERLRALTPALDSLDRSLGQLLDSAAGKIDFQIGRIEEGVRSKARLLLHRRHPELKHLREFLKPRGKPQERSFVLWTPELWEGPGARVEIRRLVAAWLERGAGEHALIALEEREEA